MKNQKNMAETKNNINENAFDKLSRLNAAKKIISERENMSTEVSITETRKK